MARRPSVYSYRRISHWDSDRERNITGSNRCTHGIYSSNDRFGYVAPSVFRWNRAMHRTEQGDQEITEPKPRLA